MLSDRKTRTARVLRRLLDANGDWVPAPALADEAGLQLGARLHEIRHRLHFDIENRMEVVAGQKQSWYRLRLTSPVSPTKKRGAVTSSSSDLLFDIPPNFEYPD
jgi:hypothetical protein